MASGVFAEDAMVFRRQIAKKIPAQEAANRLRAQREEVGVRISEDRATAPEVL
jgi:hypothetical protein